MSNKGAVGIAIKRIKPLLFYVDEKLFKPDLVVNPIRIDFQPLISFVADKGVLDFTIRIIYKYPETDDLLLDFKLQNLFEISNPEDHFIGTNIELPKEAWATILGLSVSHARSLLFNMSAGTVYQEIMLPIVNPAELGAILFPDEFK